MKVVFIAHPLAGDIENNIAHAKTLSRAISDATDDVTPFCPIILYAAFLDDTTPDHRQRGIKYCRSILPLCDELWLAKGWRKSQGCMSEYHLAKKLDMPIYEVQVTEDKLQLKPVGDHIICIVGESGSGKTAIAKALSGHGYNVIQSYTTRPQRYDDEWGHIYVNADNYSFTIVGHEHLPIIQDQTTGRMTRPIAYTYYDGHHYWATAEQYRDKGVTIYVIDPEGLGYMYDVIDDARITSIYLKTNPTVRTLRMQHRDPETIAQRLEHDSHAFQQIRCDYCIDNNGALHEVIPIMMRIIHTGGVEYCLPKGT